MKFLERARERLFATSTGDKSRLEATHEQSAEDLEIVSYVRQKLEESRASSARIAQEGINLTNIAYLCGFDSVYYDGTVRQFRPVPQPSLLLRKNRVHVNRILPTIQNRTARLLKNAPRWDVRPKSSDEDDKDAARLAEQIIIQLWDQLKINQKRIPLTMWLQQAGSAYFKVSFDPTLGNKHVYPKEVTNEDGSTTVEYEIVAEGDIRVDVCSFFEIFPDPMAKNWEELRYLSQAKIRSTSYFEEHYERGYLVKAEDCWLNSLQYESRINAMNTLTGSAGAPTVQMKDCAIEISHYERPSKKHPYGRHIIIANGVKLKDDILPIDEIPFIKFDDVVIGGKFSGEAIITHLRPQQDHLNKNKSMRAAWMSRLLAGKYLYARGHNLGRESATDQSGELWAYDPVPGASEPHAIQPPSIPEYAYKEEESSKLDMDDTAGINEASRGQMPSASIPAVGMQLLVEQDDTRIGIEVEHHEYSYADLGRILLKFVDKYYETPRLLKIAGENMEYTVREFKGADIRGNFDVHVIKGSTLPGSKVLRRQEIINLHQQGYFGNPQDPLVVQNVLAMLEFGDEEQSWKRHSLRMNQIKRGLRMIEEESMKPPVSEFDDHALWVQQFDDYRISEKFMLLDEVKQSLIIEVMNDHLSFIQEMSGPNDDPDTDPELKLTTAAAEQEQAIMAEGGGAEPALPPDVMAG